MYRTHQFYEPFIRSQPHDVCGKFERDHDRRSLFEDIKKLLPTLCSEAEERRVPLAALDQTIEKSRYGNMTEGDIRKIAPEMIKYLLHDCGFKVFRENITIRDGKIFKKGELFYKPTESVIFQSLNTAFPIIYFATKEEARVEQAVREWAAGENPIKQVEDWSINSASQEVKAQIAVQSIDLSREIGSLTPIGILNAISRSPDADRIYILKDIHRHLPGTSDSSLIGRDTITAFIIRAFRDTFYTLKKKANGARVVLIAPDAQVPVELEQEVHIVDVPVPSRDSINVRLRKFMKDVEKARIEKGLICQIRGRSDQTKLIARLTDAAVGLTALELDNILNNVLEAEGRLSADLPAKIVREKQQIIRKSGVLEFIPREDISTIQVGGLERLQHWLAIRKYVFQEAEKAREFGVRDMPRGVLLLGISGCGKSLSAKVIARDWGLPLLRLDAGAIQNALHGESEARMRKALRVAESVAPCILWIDEIEKGFGSQSTIGGGDVGQRILSTLLVWMQERQAPVFTVATANDITQLPPEMMRAGRFDNRFFIGCVNSRGRKHIFNSHLTHRGRDPKKFSTNKLAAATHGFSGAEIEQVVVDSLYVAFRDGQELSDEHLIRSIEQTRPLISTLGNQMEKIWSLIENGQVESASDQLLTKADVEILIDPDKYFPMYCRLESIRGRDREAKEAYKHLYTDLDSEPKIVLMGLGNPENPEWIYGHCNFRYQPDDAYDFKFCDRFKTVIQNDILTILIENKDVDEVIVTTPTLYKKIMNSKIPKDYFGYFVLSEN